MSCEGTNQRRMDAPLYEIAFHNYNFLQRHARPYGKVGKNCPWKLCPEKALLLKIFNSTMERKKLQHLQGEEDQMLKKEKERKNERKKEKRKKEQKKRKKQRRKKGRKNKRQKERTKDKQHYI